MSTPIQTDAGSRPAERADGACRPSLGGLVEKLESLTQLPRLDTLQAWLAEAIIPASELLPFMLFKPGNYARNRIVRNEFAELLCLCWMPGHRTPIHDHNGSVGAVRVYNGILWETVFRLDDGGTLKYDRARECRAGAVTGADVPDIHQLGNPDVSGSNLVTLHIYSPPLSVLNTYKIGSADVASYTVDESGDTTTG